jgi:hypothetical protein
MANRIATDPSRPYVLTDQANGRQIEATLIERWSIVGRRLASFRVGEEGRRLRRQATLTIARPEHPNRPMARAKVVRNPLPNGRGFIIDLLLFKTK